MYTKSVLHFKIKNGYSKYVLMNLYNRIILCLIMGFSMCIIVSIGILVLSDLINVIKFW